MLLNNDNWRLHDTRFDYWLHRYLLDAEEYWWPESPYRLEEIENTLRKSESWFGSWFGNGDEL